MGGYGEDIEVYSHGVALAIISRATSRVIFADAARTFVVKVDRSLPQAQCEAATWATLTPEDRQYFATPLEVGEDYIVQEFVPMDKTGHHANADAARTKAADLWARYMRWDEQHPWTQYGIDTRTGMLSIHDYPMDDFSGSYSDGHHFTTL
jgi:hypothetical protein